MNKLNELLGVTDQFVNRHLGPSEAERKEMLNQMRFSSLDEMVQATVPKQIRLKKNLNLPEAKSEFEALAELRTILSQNQIYKNYVGLGYYGTITPPVILRNITENPGWYTQYTPYQAEISQGRLEALLNFQTMIMDLTGFPIANASLLDEATASAEAMNMCFNVKNRPVGRAFFVSRDCFPQTIELIKTRARPLGIEVIVGDGETFDFSKPLFGAIVQYPASDGTVNDYQKFIEKAHNNDALVVMAADILSLAIMTPPGELGADIAVGSTQRLGVPMGYGGPHAAYMATKDDYKRIMPGRLVGISKDADGKPAIRMALQTREQHIRREKATSNICTAQVLLAIMASMYGIYHGPDGLRKIAERINRMTALLRKGLGRLGYDTGRKNVFDTLLIKADSNTVAAIHSLAKAAKINLRMIDNKTLGVSLDETTLSQDLMDLLGVFAKAANKPLNFTADDLVKEMSSAQLIGQSPFARKSGFMTHPVFNKYHCETEMLRYMTKLQAKDLSLTGSMIPLGSCTMKLNATSEMMPITWPEATQLHPFAPQDQAKGYHTMFKQLETWLSEITGFEATSLQPNAGSQGEYSGLLVIRRYHESRGQGHRNVCLIPKSAHGTNPASAAMVGMNIVVVDCDEHGNINVEDLRVKAQEHASNLSCLMVTYPSTHGVFEEAILDICKIIHDNGGQVYMDGANMNAQVGLTNPATIGADVCHLNLHKTFAIPHGGGGPGMGPICVKSHLAPFLPSHPVVNSNPNPNAVGPVSAAPWGSASVLPISWMYIRMMGERGLKLATEVAILNANYVAKQLDAHYPVLYKGKEGRVAHECIFDLRPLKEKTGIEAADVAKRLMDYGFHAPTMSFPVPGTLMVEPTESESKYELDRFCEAMTAIRSEIKEIEEGKADKNNNVLKNAPHTADRVTKTEWNYPYTRERAAFPVNGLRESKFWPSVARINDVLGDRQLVCSCQNWQ